MVKGCDAIGRRSRSHPQPSGKRITLQSRDLLWLQKLHEHGPLPSSFLLEYCKATHTNERRAKDRLTNLFHENNTPDQGFYLTRPAQQFRTADSRYNQLVYDVTKSGRKALERERPGVVTAPTNTGHWVHKLMVACTCASIELACRDREDVNYISGSTILQRANAELGCSVTIKHVSNPQVLASELIPDALFGLEYVGDHGQSYRFFALEADRSTEPFETTNKSRKSFAKTLAQYRAYVEGGAYRDHLNLTAPLLVLNVTNDKARKSKMLEMTAKHFPTGCSYMLYAHWRDFGTVFNPPEPKLDLLNGSWKRAGMDDLSIGSP
ncbi:MAG: replication-relaxation family protein [Erythrobacter sp.]